MSRTSFIFAITILSAACSGNDLTSPSTLILPKVDQAPPTIGPVPPKVNAPVLVHGMDFTVTGPTECIHAPQGIYQWELWMRNSGPRKVHVVAFAAHDEKPGCEATIKKPLPNAFVASGQHDFTPQEYTGTTQFRFDSSTVKCGRVQLDASLIDEDTTDSNVIGYMLDYGVECYAPDPPIVIDPRDPGPHIPTPIPPNPGPTPIPPVPTQRTNCIPGNEITLEFPLGSQKNIIVSAGYATGKFWITPGCTQVPVSLVSYTKNGAEKFPQKFFFGDLAYFNAGGPYFLQVPVAPCAWQVDLRKGGFVQGEDLTQENEDNDYGPRTLDYRYNNGCGNNDE